MDYDKKFTFISMVLFILIIVLSIQIFNSNIYFDFNKINFANIYRNLASLKINLNYSKDKIVNYEQNYIKDGSSYYSKNNEIYSLNDGVIIYCNEDKIVIHQNDDYFVRYDGYFILNVNKYDYVEKNTKVAFSYQLFDIEIYNKHDTISFEKYLQITF